VVQRTRGWVPTRLSEIEQTQIEVEVSNGLVNQKKSIFKTELTLSFKISLPQIRAEVRRPDEDFEQLQIYLSSAYPNVICAPVKKCKPGKFKSSRYVTKREILLTRFLKTVLRNRILRGDQYLMSFVSETDEKRYRQEFTKMTKLQPVKQIADLITMNGQIELTQEQVSELQKTLQPKILQEAQTAEKSTMFLYNNIKRFGLDMQSLAKTSENIQYAFKTLLNTSYAIDPEKQTGESSDYAKYFYKSSMEAFSAYSAHMNQVAKYMLDDASKFFEYLMLEGEKIGEVQSRIQEF
jgi:hypothetical protein